MIYCHVTTGCNMPCNYCFSKGRGAELSAAQWLAVLESLDEECRELDLTGGEPLHRWDEVTKPIIEWQAAKYFNRYYATYLSTNGTLVTPEIAAYLTEHKVRATVTLNGPPTYVDANMGAGTHAAILVGLNNLQAAGTTTRLRLVLTRDNLEHLDYFKAMAGVYASPFETNVIQKLFGVNPGFDISPEQEAAIVAAGEEPGFVLNATFNGMRPCFVPSITIRPDGKVIPCAAQWDRVLGDVLTEDIQTIMGRCTADMVYGCRS